MVDYIITLDITVPVDTFQNCTSFNGTDSPWTIQESTDVMSFDKGIHGNPRCHSDWSLDCLDYSHGAMSSVYGNTIKRRENKTLEHGRVLCEVLGIPLYVIVISLTVIITSVRMVNNYHEHTGQKLCQVYESETSNEERADDENLQNLASNDEDDKRYTHNAPSDNNSGTEMQNDNNFPVRQYEVRKNVRSIQPTLTKKIKKNKCKENCSEYWKRKKKRKKELKHCNCLIMRKKRYPLRKHKRKIIHRNKKLRRQLINLKKAIRKCLNTISFCSASGKYLDKRLAEKTSAKVSEDKQVSNVSRYLETSPDGLKKWVELNHEKLCTQKKSINTLFRCNCERTRPTCTISEPPEKHEKTVCLFQIQKQNMEEKVKKFFSEDNGKLKKVLFPQELIASHSCSYYITLWPLDKSNESPIMRYHSFRNWPEDSAVSGETLANNGFVCIDNDQQKVECINCGCQLIVSELQGRELSAAHRENSPNCPYANGRLHIATMLEDGLQQVLNRVETSRPYQPYAGLGQTDAFLSSRLQTAVTLTSVNSTNVNVNSENQTQSEQAAIATQSRENAAAVQGAIGNASYNIRNPQQSTAEARRQTYMYWPHEGEQDIDLLVEAGFFFTGTEDIVRCFYCDIGLAEWNPDDDPWIEHARHSPDCPYLRDKKGQDYITQVQQDWARIYTPKRPELSQMNTRLRTFDNASWPRNEVAQTPQQLAAAGFYYTGEGDTVRCHYCDGGLREWEPNDDPWVEHARWFPFCKFVLKVKGIQFIQTSATGNPNNAPPVQTQTLPTAFHEPVPRISYVDECKKKEQKNPLLSAAALSVMSMGYSRGTVWLAINSYIVKTGRRDFKARDLLDSILEREDKGELLYEDEDMNRPQPYNEPSRFINGSAEDGLNEEDEMELTPEALRKENEYLIEKFKCLICHERERSIVYVPCGHRIVCDPCGKEQKHCSHCGVKVDRRVKTYLC